MIVLSTFRQVKVCLKKNATYIGRYLNTNIIINDCVFIARIVVKTSRLKLDLLTRVVKTPRKHGKESSDAA